MGHIPGCLRLCLARLVSPLLLHLVSDSVSTWMSHPNGKLSKHVFGISIDMRGFCMDYLTKPYQIQALTWFALFCLFCFVLLEQNEVSEVKKEETLLDLDFDPFKPETASAGSAGVTHSPMSQVSSGFYVWRCYIINFNKLSKATFALQLPLSLLNDFFLIDRYFLLGEKGIKKTLSISIILNHPPTSSH